MKSFTAVLFLLFSMNLFAQKKGDNQQCTLFHGLRLKIIDTMTFNVIFDSFIEARPGDAFLDSLVKRKLVKRRRFGSEIVFKKKDCTAPMYAPLQIFNDKQKILAPDSFECSVWITCVVFKAYTYSYGGDPYFIVINITREKPVRKL